MVAVTTYRMQLPADCPWFAVGPVWSGRGEWRRKTGVSVSVGRRAVAVQWTRRRA